MYVCIHLYISALACMYLCMYVCIHYISASTCMYLCILYVCRPMYVCRLCLYVCIHYSFIQAIFIAPFTSTTEALLTQHGYCVGISRQSAKGNCERRTCPRSLRGGVEPITLRTKGVDSF